MTIIVFIRSFVWMNITDEPADHIRYAVKLFQQPAAEYSRVHDISELFLWRTFDN